MTNKEIRNRQWFVWASPIFSRFVSPGQETVLIEFGQPAEPHASPVPFLYTLDECLCHCRNNNMHEVQPETVIRYLRKQRQLARKNESISPS
jgi:hypothetical protein